MGSLAWAFAISDRMSGPAASAAKSVDKVTASLQKADKAAKKFEASLSHAGKAALRTPTAYQSSAKAMSGFGRAIQMLGKYGGQGAVDSALSMASAMGKADDALISVGSSLGGVASTAALSFAGAIAAAVAAVAALTAGIGFLAAKGIASFAKFAVEVGAFRETTMVTLEAMLGTASAADSVYESAKRMAATTPFATKDVITQYKQLLALGFKQSELERTFRAIGNLAAVRGDPAIMGQITLAMGQIRAAGRLMGQELLQLQNAGLGKGDVLAAIAKKTGKSLDEVRKMQETGKIDAETAIEAIITVIETKYGTVMAKQSETLTGLWSTVLSRPFELMDAAIKAAAAKGTGLAKFYDGLKTAVKWARDIAIDDKGELTDRGKRIVQVLQRMGQILATVFGRFDTKAATAAFDKILNTIETIMPYLQAFASGFMKGFMSALGPLAKAFGAFEGKADEVQTLAWAFEMLGKGVGYLIGLVVEMTALFAGVAAAVGVLGGAVVGAAMGIIDAVVGVVNTVLSYGGAMFGAGMNLVMGLADGIRAGIGAAVSAAMALGSSVEGAVRASLDMHSPSKKMKALGLNAGGSFGGGIEESAPRVKSSVYDMVTPPTPRQLPAGPMAQSTALASSGAAMSSGAGAGPSGRPSMTFTFGDIHIGNGGDAQAVKRGMMEAWEEIALEFGGA